MDLCFGKGTFSLLCALQRSLVSVSTHHGSSPAILAQLLEQTIEQHLYLF